MAVLLILFSQLVDKLTQTRQVLAQSNDRFFYYSLNVTEINVGLWIPLYRSYALLVQADQGFDKHLVIILPPIRYDIIQVVFNDFSILRNVDFGEGGLILTIGLVVLSH